MKRTTLLTAAAAGVIAAVFLADVRPQASAHCEIPCGIYDDHARIVQMLEDTTTIGKSVDSILELSGAHDALGLNQSVRWIRNKDDHATKIQGTIAQYFLTQRVKTVAAGAKGREEYLTTLAEHHAVMVAAMKTKQRVDRESVARLRQAIERLSAHYSGHRH